MEDPRGVLGGHRVVGDPDDRLLEIAVEDAELAENLVGALAVEVAGWLVGDDQVGVGDDRTRDRDALLLAAGESAVSRTSRSAHDRGQRLVHADLPQRRERGEPPDENREASAIKRDSLIARSGPAPRRRNRPELRQQYLNRSPLSHGHRSLRPSRSESSLWPWTTRRPRLTWASLRIPPTPLGHDLESRASRRNPVAWDTSLRERFIKIGMGLSTRPSSVRQFRDREGSDDSPISARRARSSPVRLAGSELLNTPSQQLTIE
jgi:hypothetical protein